MRLKIGLGFGRSNVILRQSLTFGTVTLTFGGDILTFGEAA